MSYNCKYCGNNVNIFQRNAHDSICIPNIRTCHICQLDLLNSEYEDHILCHSLEGNNSAPVFNPQSQAPNKISTDVVMGNQFEFSPTTEKNNSPLIQQINAKIYNPYPNSSQSQSAGKQIFEKLIEKNIVEKQPNNKDNPFINKPFFQPNSFHNEQVKSSNQINHLIKPVSDNSWELIGKEEAKEDPIGNMRKKFYSTNSFKDVGNSQASKVSVNQDNSQQFNQTNTFKKPIFKAIKDYSITEPKNDPILIANNNVLPKQVQFKLAEPIIAKNDRPKVEINPSSNNNLNKVAIKSNLFSNEDHIYTQTKQELVDMLPESTVINPSLLKEKECSICMCDYSVNEKILTIPCLHYFHNECIRGWLKKDNTCPTCKFLIDKESMLGPCN